MNLNELFSSPFSKPKKKKSNERVCKTCGVWVGKGKSYCSKECSPSKNKNYQRIRNGTLLCGFEGCKEPRLKYKHSCEYHTKENINKRSLEEIVSCNDCGCELGIRKDFKWVQTCDGCKEIRYTKRKERMSKYSREYRKKNREKINKYHREYFKKNREKIILQKKKWEDENPEKVKEIRKQIHLRKKERYRTDEEYRERRKKLHRDYKRKRYNTDEEYRKNVLKKGKERRKKNS